MHIQTERTPIHLRGPDVDQIQQRLPNDPFFDTWLNSNSFFANSGVCL